MNTSILTLIASSIFPVLLTFAFGILAGKWKHFSEADAEKINRLILLYTLPLGLFFGMMHIPKQVMLGMGPQSFWLVLALALAYGIPWLVMRHVLGRGLAESTLQAMVMGTPSILFIGFPILTPLLGPAPTTLLVVVSGLIQNLLVLPVTLVLMSMATDPAGHAASFTTHVKAVVKHPIVLVPALSLLMVFFEVKPPEWLIQPAQLLGQATGGLAIFSAGVVLQARSIMFSPSTIYPVLVRNVLIPYLCFAGLKAFGASPTLTREIVLTMAIPTGSIALVVAMKYKTMEGEVASSVALSTMAALVTMGAFVALTA